MLEGRSYSMRGAVILISVVLVSCLTVEAHAGCNAERFDFGTSLETVMDAFNVEKSVERLPSLPGLSERFLQLSGKEVCPDDPAFAGATITYNFLADQLVEIQLELSQRASPRLTLLDWAIQRHGRPTIQTKGPVATMSSGQWTWERPKTFAFLYLVRRNNQAIQEFSITSIAHQGLFEQRWKRKEEVLPK